MVPGRCLGDIQGLPEASRGPVRAGFQTQLKISAKLKASERRPGRPGRHPGKQRDPKNQLKTEFVVKKCVPNVDSPSIFEYKAVFYAFCKILHRFFTEKIMKINLKTCSCSQQRLYFFEHCDPHETSYFTIRKLLFHFLGLRVFSKKASNT